MGLNYTEGRKYLIFIMITFNFAKDSIPEVFFGSHLYAIKFLANAFVDNKNVFIKLIL